MAPAATQKPVRGVRKSAVPAIKQEITTSDDAGILTSPGAIKTSASSHPQAARRREIPQEDDGELLRQYSEKLLP